MNDIYGVYVGSTAFGPAHVEAPVRRYYLERSGGLEAAPVGSVVWIQFRYYEPTGAWLHPGAWMQHAQVIEGKEAEDIRDEVYKRLVLEGNLDHTARYFDPCRARLGMETEL